MKNYLLGTCFLVLAFFLIWQQGTEQIEYTDRQKDAISLSPSPEDSFDDNLSLSEESLNPEISHSDADSFLFK